MDSQTPEDENDFYIPLPKGKEFTLVSYGTIEKLKQQLSERDATIEKQKEVIKNLTNEISSLNQCLRVMAFRSNKRQ